MIITCTFPSAPYRTVMYDGNNNNNDNIPNRAKREAELMERGTPASEAALRADKELTEKEESQQQELTATLAAEK